MKLEISLDDSIAESEVLALYRANHWSSADKPAELMAALRSSHSLVTARLETRTGKRKLVGIGNAISDGHLVVYYPHMLVHPEYHGKGIGKQMMRAMQGVYGNFHQQMLTADGNAIKFYEALGFESAGNTQSMWVYAGNEH